MGRSTYFVVQGFQRGPKGKGRLIAEQPRLVRTREQAAMMAQRLAERRPAVLAFSRAGDPDVGEFDDAEIIAQHGEVPQEIMDAME